MNCPVVTTDNGLHDTAPCGDGVCWPWYVRAWRLAIAREIEIAERLSSLLNANEQHSLTRAKQEVATLPTLWSPVFQGRSLTEQAATIAKAVRCLWWGAAVRARGVPSPVTVEGDPKTAQQAWWAKWLPDVGSWSPRLSWPALPGFDIDFKSIWEKLKSWGLIVLPWLLGGIALWLFLPTLVRSVSAARRR